MRVGTVLLGACLAQEAAVQSKLSSAKMVAWDSRRERFPPGEKLSNKVQNLARKRVQPDRLEATPFKDPNSKVPSLDCQAKYPRCKILSERT